MVYLMCNFSTGVHALFTIYQTITADVEKNLSYLVITSFWILYHVLYMLVLLYVTSVTVEEVKYCYH